MLQEPLPVTQRLVFPCLAGGALERFQARLQLGQEVIEAVGVGLGFVEVALGLGDLQPESGEVGGVLEQAASLLGPLAERGVDHPLPDHGVALAERGGELGDILEANPAPIQEVLVLAAPVGAAGDGHFGEFALEPAILVVEGDGDFGHPGRGATLAPGEDDILGLLRAEGAVAGFPEHPAHRIGDVRLARAVRTDHGGNAGLEDQHGARGKALEPVQVEPGKPWSRLSGTIGHRAGPGDDRLMGGMSAATRPHRQVPRVHQTPATLVVAADPEVGCSMVDSDSRVIDRVADRVLRPSVSANLRGRCEARVTT